MPEDDGVESEGSSSRQRRQRRGRDLNDISSLFGEEKQDQPEAPVETPVEQEAEPEKKTRRRRDARNVLNALTDSGEQKPTEGESTPSMPRPKRQRRSASSLSVLMEGEGADKTRVEEEAPAFPPGLEKYLSPELWRKLNGRDPGRREYVNALLQLHSVFNVLSTYIPRHLAQEKMRRPVPGLVQGEILKGTLLFSDVSGFTALSEALAVKGQEGAEELTERMNGYFTRMLEIISYSRGDLIKFAGDALLVFFPWQEGGKQATWAVRAGLRMLKAMDEFASIQTPSGTVGLKMKIGIGTGEFFAASVGDEKRMEYGLMWKAVLETMGAEGASTGPGQLIANLATVEALDSAFTWEEQSPGYVRVRLREDAVLDEYEIKGENRRARGAVPYDADRAAITAQMDVAIKQILSITPYLAEELVERTIAHARLSERSFHSDFLLTTVLFCNFVGLEKLLDYWGKSGRSRVTSLFSAYFSAMQEVVSRFGGIISRIDPYSKGTKMLILFGAPTAHEDDPQRAVSAALAMNLELISLNERWKERYARHLKRDWEGELIEHRIGITQGITYAGQVGDSSRREYTVMGDDVNLSARLMSAAEMGQILINQEVHDVVSDYFYTTALRPIRVKGKSRPISIHQVDGPRDDTLIIRMKERGPLVGRTEEEKRARAVLQGALGGKSAALSIVGPAGIGKSHLADILLREALGSGATVLTMQCRAFSADRPYYNLGGVLRELAGMTNMDHAITVEKKFDRLIAEYHLPKRLGQPLAMLMGLNYQLMKADDDQEVEKDADQEEGGDYFAQVKRGRSRRRRTSLDVLKRLDDRQTAKAGEVWIQVSKENAEEWKGRFYEGITSLLDGLLGRSPLVIFFEDAHFLDRYSYTLLMEMKRRFPDRALFIMLAGREDPDGASGEPARLDMAPFGLDGTMALVSHILVSELAPIIHEQSQGNPLFIEEITRWIQRTRNLTVEEMQGVLTDSDILQKMVFSSFDSLTEDQREIARIASVIGTEFRAGEVQALVPDTVDTATLSHNISQLVEQNMLVLVEAGVNSRYAFRQSYIRDILCNSLPFERRRALYAKLADYLSAPLDARREAQAKLSRLYESGVEKDLARDYEVIALNYDQAEMWIPAAKYMRLSALEYQKGQRFERALEKYELGISILNRAEKDPGGEGQALKFQLLLGHGDMAMATGDPYLAMPIYESAETCVSAEQDMESTRVELKIRQVLAMPLIGEGAGALEFFLQSVPPDWRERDPYAACVFAWLSWRSDPARASDAIQKASRGLPAAEDWAESAATLLIDLAGEQELAYEKYKEQNELQGAALTAARMGMRALDREDFKGAERWFVNAHDIYRDRSPDCGVVLALYHLAEVRYGSGSLDAALSALGEARANLNLCSLVMRKTGAALIDEGFNRIRSQQAGGWARWDFSPYEDKFYVQVLFRRYLIIE